MPQTPSGCVSNGNQADVSHQLETNASSDSPMLPEQISTLYEPVGAARKNNSSWPSDKSRKRMDPNGVVSSDNRANGNNMPEVTAQIVGSNQDNRAPIDFSQGQRQNVVTAPNIVRPEVGPVSFSIDQVSSSSKPDPPTESQAASPSRRTFNMTPVCYEVDARLVQGQGNSQEPIFNGVLASGSTQIDLPRERSNGTNIEQQQPCRKKYRTLRNAALVLLFGVLVASIGAIITKKNANKRSLNNHGESVSVSPTEGPRNKYQTSTPISLAKSTTSTHPTSLVTPQNGTANSTADSSEEPIKGLPKLPMEKQTTQPTSPTCVKFLGTLFDSNCTYECAPIPAIDGDAAVGSRNFEYLQFFSVSDSSFEVVTTTEINYAVTDISVFGNVTVVGAALEDNGTGVVYVFEQEASGIWSNKTKIVPPDAVGQQWFGFSVSLFDDKFVVGAPFHHGDAINEGFAYVYRNDGDNWGLEAKLLPQNSKSNVFGWSVSLQGGVLAVGDFNSVSVYTFDSSINSWQQSGKTLVSDTCDGWFGDSIALTSSNEVLIGCPFENNNTGAVYYFKDCSTCPFFKQKVDASDGSPNEYFGSTDQIAEDNNIMAVGTYSESGKTYVFSKVDNVWTEKAKINAPSGTAFFGDHLALSDSKLLVSSSTNVFSYSLDGCG